MEWLIAIEVSMFDGVEPHSLGWAHISCSVGHVIDLGDK